MYLIMDHERFFIGVMRDLLKAEAAYRSAMKIYKDHPSHYTRIKAESDWHHAKQIVKAVVRGARPADEHTQNQEEKR